MQLEPDRSRTGPPDQAGTPATAPPDAVPAPRRRVGGLTPGWVGTVADPDGGGSAATASGPAGSGPAGSGGEPAGGRAGTAGSPAASPARVGPRSLGGRLPQDRPPPGRRAGERRATVPGREARAAVPGREARARRAGERREAGGSAPRRAGGLRWGPVGRGLRTAVPLAVLAVLAVVAATVVAGQRRPAPPGDRMATSAAAPLLAVRSGQLADGWESWSWATAVTGGRQAPDGTAAVQVDFTSGFAGFSLRRAPVRPGPAAVVRARVWAAADTVLALSVQDSDTGAGRVGPDVPVAAGRWVDLSVPVRDLDAPAQLTRLTVEHRSTVRTTLRLWVADLSVG